MKKIIMSLILVLALYVPTFSAKAQEQFMDAETLAQAFLLHDTDRYVLDLWGEMGETGPFEIHAVLNADLMVTNLQVNGTKIPITKPLGGIPLPTNGLHSVSVLVRSVDKYGDIGSQGQWQTNYLSKGDRIRVVMTPQFPPTAIQIGKDLNPNELNVEVNSAGGWGWSYDPRTGILIIMVDNPATTDLWYRVTGADGRLLAQDWLPIMQPQQGGGVGSNSALSLSNAGGVINVAFTEKRQYGYIRNTAFDSTVRRGDEVVPVKVFTASGINGLLLYMNTYSNDGSVGGVEVRKWEPSGPMRAVPCKTWADEWGNMTVVSEEYLDKAVIIIYPAKGMKDGHFDIFFSRTYGVPVPVVDGKGKPASQ